MLRSTVVGALGTAITVTGGLVVSTPTLSAQANSQVVCAERDPATQICTIELAVAFSGDPPTVAASLAGGSGGTQVYCDRNPDLPVHPGEGVGHQVHCNHPQHGWYSYSYDCYFRESASPPDADGVILPDGYEPGDPGTVYWAMCFTNSHPDIPHSNYCLFQCTPAGWDSADTAHLVFLSEEPDGFEGTADPVPGLLVEAIEELALEGPTIGTAPPAGSDTGLVRLPVWLWNETSPNNWGTPSQTAGPIAGISVVAEAEATGITWDMGDGNTVECGEGVAYQPGMPVYEPPCGHPYAQPSRNQPGEEYQIAATTTWVLEWTTQGLPEERGGEFELEATSTTSLQINELQVLYGS